MLRRKVIVLIQKMNERIFTDSFFDIIKAHFKQSTNFNLEYFSFNR